MCSSDLGLRARALGPRGAHRRASPRTPAVSPLPGLDAERMERPPGIEELQQEELVRVFGRAVTIRLRVIPFVALAAVSVAALGPSPWRIATLGSMATAMVVIAVVEAIRVRRGLAPVAARRIGANIAAMSAFQLTIFFTTGGLESPVMPVILPLAVVAGALIGPRPHLAWVTVPQFLAVWFFALGALYGWLPDVQLAFLGGGVRAGHSDAHLWTSAIFLSGGVLVATGIGFLLRSIFDRLLARAFDARAAELASHREHAAELTALSGEIAHELKNPLATIKGLAALLERDTTGKAAERLSVMRGEIDRMQGILEEFLNFSRPLVPLAVVDVQLDALCDEVVTLHEGMARSRGVTLLVDGSALARGDKRKLRQILINLVQNALEVSGTGQPVRLTVGPGPVVEVCDRGPGPPDTLGDRVFEPGVTTKPTGSGLGLTIARALARQHGGDLELLPREGGGCRARLTLPEPS